MKRKLTIAGILLVLGAAMVVAVMFSNQNANKTAPGNSVSFTPDGKIVPLPNEHAKMTVIAEMPKGSMAPATNAPPK